MLQKREQTAAKETDLHSTATGEIDFTSRTYEQASERKGEHTTHITVTSTDVQPEKSIVQIVHTGIITNLNIHYQRKHVDIKPDDWKNQSRQSPGTHL